MEFLLISEAKLKIVLERAEAESYNIDTGNIDCTDALCRRAVWAILDEAKRSVGFDPRGDKILVQFYPVKGAGCEVFITKLGILPPNSAKTVAASDRVALLSKETFIYSFESLEDLMLLARAISKRAVPPKKSDVYLAEGNRYFLVTEEYGRGGDGSEYPEILEFGRSLPESMLPYILEHSECLSRGDGIDILIKQ